MRIVGIDPSLTSTGVAIIEMGHVQLLRVKSAGKADATWAQRRSRLGELADQICSHIVGAHLLVIEGPSYGQSISGGAHDRAGLWWAIASAFEVPLAVVSPKGRAKYATGSGASSKDEVLAAVIRRHGDLPVANNDVADALTLAAMGARAVGCPIDEPLPEANRAAMLGAAWPSELAWFGTETAPLT